MGSERSVRVFYRCQECGRELQGKRRKYCCNKCGEQARRRHKNAGKFV